MKFLLDVAGRDGKWSSRKIWYNICGITSTVCLLWLTYQIKPADEISWMYIALYSIYLVTVGGFDVMLKMMTMIIEFKNGKPTTTSVETATSTKTEVQ